MHIQKFSVTVCLTFVVRSVRFAHGPAPCNVVCNATVHALTLNIPVSPFVCGISSSAGGFECRVVALRVLGELCVTRHVLTRRPNARIFRETNACAAQMNPLACVKLTREIGLAKVRTKTRMQSSESRIQNGNGDSPRPRQRPGNIPHANACVNK